MTSRCFAFDPAGGSWLEVAQLSQPRSMLSAAVVDGALLLTGGYNQEYYR